MAGFDVRSRRQLANERSPRDRVQNVTSSSGRRFASAAFTRRAPATAGTSATTAPSRSVTHPRSVRTTRSPLSIRLRNRARLHEARIESQGGFRRCTWRERTRRSLSARFALRRVVPAHDDARGIELREPLSGGAMGSPNLPTISFVRCRCGQRELTRVAKRSTVNALHPCRSRGYERHVGCTPRRAW
ncbi:MAG: hypothetical protein H6Q90_6174 [Deltaproteobacteria bacterium]|nr:hypothetical protein [Deltaproteobacteria bacterium]